MCIRRYGFKDLVIRVKFGTRNNAGRRWGGSCFEANGGATCGKGCALVGFRSKSSQGEDIITALNVNIKY